jgi:hypothetical protein
MHITAPYGYGEIMPLEKHHKVLLPGMASAGGGAVPAFAAATNAMAISFSEFAIAARDYPLVFATRDDGATYAPLAVLGLADGENLFVDGAGHWAPDTYVPAFVRRYPFCLSRVVVDGLATEQRVVCIDRAYVDEAGVALFSPAGAPTPHWTERERLLTEYESDLELTAQMCAGFHKLELFEPFTMRVDLPATPGVRSGQPAFELKGMHRINEAKFLELKAASHKALASKGWAARIYAHLFSLQNFARLHERQVARQVARKAAARH